MPPWPEVPAGQNPSPTIYRSYAPAILPLVLTVGEVFACTRTRRLALTAFGVPKVANCRVPFSSSHESVAVIALPFVWSRYPLIKYSPVEVGADKTGTLFRRTV